MIETLEEGKEFLRSNYHKGVECPCCKQFVKLYKRKLNAGMALFLIGIHKLGEGYHSNKDIMAAMKINTSSLDYSVMRHFGLISDKPNDGTEKRNSGYWRITPVGTQFVTRQITIPSHVHLYNGNNRGFSGSQVTILQCLGKKFNYNELMNLRPDL